MTADRLDRLIAPNESLYEFITRLAGAASTRSLWGTLLTSIVVGTGLAFVSLKFWPIVAACGTLSTIATWGLLEHRRQLHPARTLHVAEQALVVLGCCCAFLAIMGSLYFVLGDSWVL